MSVTIGYKLFLIGIIVTIVMIDISLTQAKVLSFDHTSDLNFNKNPYQPVLNLGGPHETQPNDPNGGHGHSGETQNVESDDGEHNGGTNSGGRYP